MEIKKLLLTLYTIRNGKNITADVALLIAKLLLAESVSPTIFKEILTYLESVGVV